MPRNGDETRHTTSDGRESEARRPYSPPTLEVVRALQEVVLGSSPGAGDSGGGSFTEFAPGGP